jgi:hypothetical protein
VIAAGLKPGERVVAAGSDKITQGQVVAPTPFRGTEGE